jgi:ethanolamine ammonia-lyase small subunit
MKHGENCSLSTSELPEIVRKVRERTPARLLLGRSGSAYRTNTQLDLREAHAAAKDAVHVELEVEKSFGAEFVHRLKIFEVKTKATSKEQYLLQPELGRHFELSSRAEILKRCSKEMGLQIVIGDGLSVSAVQAQVPALLPLLLEGAAKESWKLGQPFIIHHCRVGILNEVGELLNPRVAVLLIGERPGLATAESLSAYMVYRPKAAQTDADRNVISNIHARGLNPKEAAVRILKLAGRMMDTNTSGCLLREGSLTLGDP